MEIKTLTVAEAAPGLGRLVEMALAGGQIQIRQGDGVVELRPATTAQADAEERLTPREALRLLQQAASLTPRQADAYLREVREERLAVHRI